MSFVSTFEQSLDDKRRVTLPADFRDVLRGLRGGGAHVRVWPSPDGWLDAADDGFVELIGQAADEEAEALGDGGGAANVHALVFMNSRKLAIDSGGRIVLPEALIAHAGLRDRVAFQGAGPSFRMATPEAAAAELARLQATDPAIRARVLARARKLARGGTGS